MRESLDAACGQFEQVIIGQMLRTAGVGRTPVMARAATDAESDDDCETASNDAFAQLVVQALSAAIDRAGGIGLRGALRSAAAGHRP